MVATGIPDQPKGKSKPPPTPSKSLSSLKITGDQVILLSCFDGIGSAAFALTELIGEVFLHVAWEVDPECIAVVQQHFPAAHNRGDFMQEDMSDLIGLINHCDPNAEKIIIFASAPPCPDFSRVCEDAAGKEGQEGRKFVEYCNFSKEVKRQLHHKTILNLCENVVLQDKGEIAYFEKALECSAVVVDAADFGLVSRPRLFWTDIHWGESATPPHEWQGTQVVQVSEDPTSAHR